MPVFPIIYDPRLPPVTSLLSKHWRSMVSRDMPLKEVFPSQPLTAYKRQQQQKFIRAALANGHLIRPPYGGQYFHGCLMVKVSPPPSGQSGHTALCVS